MYLQNFAKRGYNLTDGHFNTVSTPLREYSREDMITRTFYFKDNNVLNKIKLTEFVTHISLLIFL